MKEIMICKYCNLPILKKEPVWFKMTLVKFNSTVVPDDIFCYHVSCSKEANVSED